MVGRDSGTNLVQSAHMTYIYWCGSDMEKNVYWVSDQRWCHVPIGGMMLRWVCTRVRKQNISVIPKLVVLVDKCVLCQGIVIKVWSIDVMIK